MRWDESTIVDPIYARLIEWFFTFHHLDTFQTNIQEDKVTHQPQPNPLIFLRNNFTTNFKYWIVIYKWKNDFNSEFKLELIIIYFLGTQLLLISKKVMLIISSD